MEHFMHANGNHDPKSPAQSILDQITQIAEESGAENIVDINKIAASIMGNYNQRPQADMGSLSPKQVHALTGPGWIGMSASVNESVPYSAIAAAPLFHNARHLLRTIHAMGVAKATATGAFSRSLSTQMFHDFILDDDDRWYNTKHRSVINQGDVRGLELLRHMLPAAGLLRFAKGAFNVTKRGSDLLSEQNAGRLYETLFRIFFTRMNIAALDGLAAVQGVQHCMGYSIFQFGKLDRFVTMEDAANQMFLPAVQEAIMETERDGLMASFAYLRVVRHLAAFGLAEVQMPERYYYSKSLARPTLLFDQFIRFHL